LKIFGSLPSEGEGDGRVRGFALREADKEKTDGDEIEVTVEIGGTDINVGSVTVPPIPTPVLAGRLNTVLISMNPKPISGPVTGLIPVGIVEEGE